MGLERLGYQPIGEEVQAKWRCPTFLESILLCGGLLIASGVCLWKMESRNQHDQSQLVIVQSPGVPFHGSHSHSVGHSFLASSQPEGFECQSSLDIGEIAKPWQTLVASTWHLFFYTLCFPHAACEFSRAYAKLLFAGSSELLPPVQGFSTADLNACSINEPFTK